MHAADGIIIRVNDSSPQCRPYRGVAIAALTIGLCSGPMALLSFHWYIPILVYAAPAFGAVAVLVCGTIDVAFCVLAFYLFDRSDSTSAQRLAIAGIFAAIAWTLIMLGYMYYLNAHLE